MKPIINYEKPNVMKNDKNENEPLIVTAVSGCTGSFLKNVVDELFVYKTPQKIIDYIEKHKHDYLIQNPTYEVCN